MKYFSLLRYAQLQKRFYKMTVYTSHNKLCFSVPTIVPASSTHFVFAVIRHSHIAHDASCLIRPRPFPPPLPQKKERKKTICVRITFNFSWVLKDHNAPCLPPKFCITIVFDFSWDEGNTPVDLHRSKPLISVVPLNTREKL